MLALGSIVLWANLTLLTIVLAMLILFIERKLIAIAQKRLGISFLGRNGWAHLPADLIKFWLKHTTRHSGGWQTTQLAGLTGIFSYFLWTLSSIWFFLLDGFSGVVDFWELQIPAYLAYANFSTALMITTIASFRSKYALLASARLGIVAISLEIFFGLIWILIYTHSASLSLDDASNSNAGEPIFWALPPITCWLLLFTLFEAKRAPFDHSEAESELVAGHLVEFGGRSLFLFYICEYLHLLGALALLTFIALGSAQITVIIGYGITIGTTI